MRMYHPDEYVILMAKGTLFNYLEQIDIQASNMYDRPVEQYKKQKKHNRRTKSTRSNVMGTRNE